jgi:hypothetical protein
MKKIALFLSAASVFLFTACSEKFEVAAPYKDITVVYGFLDMKDTAHYVRIQKAFIDQDKSAVKMAQVSDSSFFSNLNVRIERYLVSGNNKYVDSIHLDRVDLTAEGYPKQSGAFFNAPNYAYKFTDAIDAKYIYRIKITKGSTGLTDSADAVIISNQPSEFNVPMLDDNNLNLAGLNFFSILSKRYVTIDGVYKPEFGFEYAGMTSPANIAQATIRFNWDDSDIITKVHTPRYYDYDAGYTYLDKGTQFAYKIENTDLYAALSSGMGTAPTNVVRLLDRCDITVYLSTSDYSSYRQATLLSGNGLTGSEIAPVYTNVKGEDVLGLFTSRAMRTGKITITPKTIDSLIASPMLTHTNLKGTVYR